MGRIKNLEKSLAVLAMSGISLAGLLTGAAAMGVSIPNCSSAINYGGSSLPVCDVDADCFFYDYHPTPDTCVYFVGPGALKSCGLGTLNPEGFEDWSGGSCGGGFCSGGTMIKSGTALVTRYFDPVACDVGG